MPAVEGRHGGLPLRERQNCPNGPGGIATGAGTGACPYGNVRIALTVQVGLRPGQAASSSYCGQTIVKGVGVKPTKNSSRVSQPSR